MITVGGLIMKMFGNIDKKRVLLCFVAVFGMGFFLSFLILCDLGTDPCTFMNRSLAQRIGMSFGNWQLIMNIAMLLFVIAFGRHLIGFGTFFNMILIGYYADFFDWVWGKVLPAGTFTNPVSRWAIFIVALVCFVISAAVYMNSEVGVSPYDATANILSSKVKKVPFFLFRICYDYLAILIGVLAGMRPNVGILLMAVMLGPAVSLVGSKMKRKS